MAIYSNPQNWTILPSGQGTGSVSCGAHRGSYKWNDSGMLQIEWIDDEPPVDAVQAARAACASTDSGNHRAGKSGGLAAGG